MSDDEIVARHPETGEWMTEDEVIAWLRMEKNAPETDISIVVGLIQTHREMGLTVSGGDLRKLIGNDS